jgi:hypothetical protein
MKVCPKCYGQNPDDARFCRNCGASVDQRTCPAGLHTMDPTWTECAYCRAEGLLGNPASATPRRPTEIENNPGPSEGSVAQRGKTQFRDPALPTPQGGPSTAGRKIVGILITYSWRPDGQLFAVREGRNLIGRDPEKCEIAIPDDQTLSAVNSHITFRKSFVIGDNVSMSGTDLDGEPIEEQFKPLGNYATIRTGSTHWTFIAVSPAEQSAAESPSPTPPAN